MLLVQWSEIIINYVQKKQKKKRQLNIRAKMETDRETLPGRSVLICSLYSRRLRLPEQRRDLFTKPSSPEDVHVIWEARISRALAMQIFTQQ